MTEENTNQVKSYKGERNNANRKSKLKKRNKNARFLSNVKGFGKKGIYGRGTHIEDDQYSYFVNILDSLREGFETLDDKETMANNVIEQTSEKEIHLSSNQIVSKAIENLIGYTSAEHFERFQTVFAENFRPICSDKFASHVLEKIIEICFLRAIDQRTVSDDNEEPKSKRNKLNLQSEKTYNITQNFTADHRKKCSEFLVKIGKFLLNNLEDFVWDCYASHIIRTSILSLAGIYVNKVAFERNNRNVVYENAIEVPSEWKIVVKEYANRLQMWPQFSDFPYDTLSSTLLGSIATALKAIDKSTLKHYGKKILNDAFLKADDCDDRKKIEIDDNEEKKDNSIELKLPKVFSKESSIRLLETLLTVAGPKLFTQLYTMLFCGRQKTLSLNRATNFAVQKLIENVKEIDDFEAIFDELHTCIEDLLKAGHTGVIQALCSTCLRLSTKQGAFVTALQAALHTTGSKEKHNAFIMAVLKLKPYEDAIEDKTQNILIHGSLIIQNMLEFSKPIKLVQSILETPANDLVGIFCTPNGSYIADTFVKSKTIGEKSREKLIKHLEGNYLAMASTRFGSRVLENLFGVAMDVQKAKIAKELANNVNQLNGTMFGRVLCEKFRIRTYQLSETEWKAAFQRAKKAETLFEDIIN